MPHLFRLLTALLTALSGATVMAAMTWPVSPNDGPLLLAASGGALVSGALCAGLFGHPGRRGIGIAVFGALLATTIGAALAGLAFLLRFDDALMGLVAGPVIVMMSVATDPPVMLAWTLTMALTHAAALRMRRRPFLPI